MIRRPPRSTPSNSSAASDVYKRQILNNYGITSFNTHAMSNPSLHLPSQHLRTHVNILSAPLEPSGSCSHFERLRGASSLDQAFRALQRRQKCCQVHCLRAARPSDFERLGGDERTASSGAEGASSGAEGARAAISNAPSEPRWLDVANVGRYGVFAARPSHLIELLSAWNVEAVNIYSVEFTNMIN